MGLTELPFMSLASQLTTFQSHAAIAVIAVLGWVFVVTPLWRRYREHISHLEGYLRGPAFSFKNPLTKWVAASVVVSAVFLLGLWIGWHREWTTATFVTAFRKNATVASSPATGAVAPVAALSAPPVALQIASPSAALTPA